MSLRWPGPFDRVAECRLPQPDSGKWPKCMVGINLPPPDPEGA